MSQGGFPPLGGAALTEMPAWYTTSGGLCAFSRGREGEVGEIWVENGVFPRFPLHRV
jgi:hypothetical protein